MGYAPSLLTQWAINYGTAVHIGSASTVNISKLQASGYSNAVVIDNTSIVNGSGPYTLTNSEINGCSNGVVITGTVSNPITVTNSRFSCYNVYTYLSGVVLTILNNTSISALQFNNNSLFGNIRYAVLMNQTTQTLTNIIINNNLAFVNTSGNTGVLITTGTNIMVIGNIWKNFTTGVNVPIGSTTANNLS